MIIDNQYDEILKRIQNDEFYIILESLFLNMYNYSNFDLLLNHYRLKGG